jgi:hypothetical protein
MEHPEKRQDRETAAVLWEGERMRRAFGAEAARTFLERRAVRPDLVERVIAGRVVQR